MAREPSEWDVRQLRSRACATQHETAAAHIASSDEFFWKQQPVTEDANHRFEVLRCRNASEKDKIAVFARRFIQEATVLFQWKPVARIRDVDRNGCELLKVFHADDGLGRDQAAGRGDDEYTGNAAWRRGKRLRIGHLSTEVQSADKCECFSQSGSAFTQTDCQIELSARPCQ